jgi:drug/metabolite transporter (DMT)-like permease
VKEASSSKDSQSRLFFLLIAAIFAVSISSILVRLSQSPPLVLAFYRQLFSALLLLPFVMNDPKSESLDRGDYPYLIASGLFLALHFATWITSLTLTSVARAVLFVDLQPIWAALLGAVFLGESLSGLEILAVGIVTAGGILTILPHWSEGAASVRGDLLALSGGIAGACYLLIGRKLRTRISWLSYMFSVYLISAAWLLLFYGVRYRYFPLPVTHDLLLLFLMALIPSLAGHGLFNLVIRNMKAYVVNAAFFGEPILATILAAIIFREYPDPYFYGGALIVFAGLALIFSQQKNRVEESEP